MEDKKICPEWAKTALSESLGRCKQTIGWLCQKGYAIENYESCAFYKGTQKRRIHDRIGKIKVKC